MQNVICSSRSMPRSAAPLTMSSRLTERAKALSFIRFRIDFASTSASDLVGFTSAVAVINAADVFGPTAFGEDCVALVGMLFGAGIPFVVEVVDEADVSPEIFVFSEFSGVSAQARFHRNGVFTKTF